MGAGGLTVASERLLAAVARDQEVRDGLVARGVLAEGYHPEMRAIHEANADLLGEVIAEQGWPDAARFGEAVAEAAWRIVQHAIGRPGLQRVALHLMRAADAAPAHCAMLEDRIAFYEGRPQRFGTQLDWNDAGELMPWTIAEPDRVEELRADVGLPPLATHVAQLRSEALRPPADLAAHRAAAMRWMIEAGWRS